MTAQTRATLKTYFETGDKPTQSQFGDTIDSFLSLSDTGGQKIISDVSAQGNFEVNGTFTASAFNAVTINATTLSATLGNITTLNSTTVSAGTLNAVTLNAINISANTYSSPSFSVASTGIVTPKAIVGTVTNDSASSGQIGEYITSNQGTPQALTTATALNVTSISLTAGDWDVWIDGVFSGGTTTLLNYIIASISITSATINGVNGNFTQVSYGGTGVNIFNSGGTATPVAVVGPVRLSLSATTTVYLVAQAGFTVSTCSAFGIIQARRVR